ncbi:tetratricopeptide repeat protein, partial [Nodularia sp. UHCC 0506]|uniref:tetratricopeptide repeat protein n=1 Tax=Nodularia sp. UHCC 0506 TaxID=3110243 RepID=UPI002B1FBC62
ALEFKPDDHYAWNSRGYALGNLGRYEEAIASFDKALEFKPDYHKAWYYRGIALGKLGRRKEAFASASKAAEINPDFAMAQAKQIIDNLLQKLGWNKLTKFVKGVLRLIGFKHSSK